MFYCVMGFDKLYSPNVSSQIYKIYFPWKKKKKILQYYTNTVELSILTVHFNFVRKYSIKWENKNNTNI